MLVSKIYWLVSAKYWLKIIKVEIGVFHEGKQFQFGQKTPKNIYIYNINNLRSLIYRGQGRDFLVKIRGLSIIEGTVFHWYVYMDLVAIMLFTQQDFHL